MCGLVIVCLCFFSNKNDNVDNDNNLVSIFSFLSALKMAASGGGAAGGGSVVWMAVWFFALWFVGKVLH